MIFKFAYHIHYLIENDHQFSEHKLYQLEPVLSRGLATSLLMFRSILKGASLPIVEAALADLDSLIDISTQASFPSTGQSITTAEEARWLLNDEFLLIKSLFEGHQDLACDLKLNTSFNIYQFYALVGMYYCAISNTFIDNTSMYLDAFNLRQTETLKAFRACSQAREVSSHLNGLVFGELAASKIEHLTQKTLKQSFGGLKGTESRYGSVDDRREKCKQQTQDILQKSKAYHHKNPHWSMQYIKKKVGKELSISTSTIDTRVPKYGKTIKSL